MQLRIPSKVSETVSRYLTNAWRVGNKARPVTNKSPSKSRIYMILGRQWSCLTSKAFKEMSGKRVATSAGTRRWTGKAKWLFSQRKETQLENSIHIEVRSGPYLLYSFTAFGKLTRDWSHLKKNPKWEWTWIVNGVLTFRYNSTSVISQRRWAVAWG